MPRLPKKNAILDISKTSAKETTAFKLQWHIVFLIFGFLALAFFGFLFLNAHVASGLNFYKGSLDFCGAHVVESSALSSPATCDTSAFASSNNGALIDEPGVVFNCDWNEIKGPDYPPIRAYGFDIEGDGVVVENCPLIHEFKTELKISSNAKVVNSGLRSINKGENDVVITPTGDVTFLNVSFDTDRVKIEKGGSLEVQSYLRVYVNKGDNPDSGVRVRVQSLSGYPGRSVDLTGITNSKGFVDFNVTKEFENSESEVFYDYNVEVTDLNTRQIVKKNFYNPLLSGMQEMTFSLESNDHESPGVELVSPDGILTRKGDLNFSAALDDNEGLSRAELFIWDSGGNIVSHLSRRLNGSKERDVQMSADISGYSDGKYHWNYFAEDTSGNGAWGAVNRSFEVDRISPEIYLESLSNVENYSEENRNVEFKFNVSDESDLSSCFAHLSGTLTEDFSDDSPIVDGVNIIESRNLDAGSYKVYVYCNDSVGNVGKSETLGFSIVKPGDEGNDKDNVSGGSGVNENESNGKISQTCQADEWFCGNWGDCVGGEQKRSCVSDCGGMKYESKSCIFTNVTLSRNKTCQDQCTPGNYCDARGTHIVICKMESDGCYAIVGDIVCAENTFCLNARCVSLGSSKNSSENILYYLTPNNWFPKNPIQPIVVNLVIVILILSAIILLIWRFAPFLPRGFFVWAEGDLSRFFDEDNLGKGESFFKRVWLFIKKIFLRFENSNP